MAATNMLFPFWEEEFGTDTNSSAEGSPSAEDVRAGLSEGLAIVSEIFGVVIGIVGNVAILADGTEVPVSDLGPTTAGAEPLPPEPDEWIEGVPNVATLGLGLVALLGVIMVLK